MLKNEVNNLLETYLDYFIQNWLSENFSFEEFPFKLFSCENKNSFYLKYLDICLPYFIVTDRRDMLQAVSQLQLTEKDIVEVSDVKITSMYC